ncbi:GNAT family N-acetyltransferase [Massilia sp. YIM B04103]|uniref:GNAT family N-acetyltransferase n=1 Tax=Massilia sp. YIM B04103 TaxID=2963106 RepID=UPI00210C1B79|nr:GNAT family N-acetyltransferase [Massilia sp. YIM B04103]
MGLDIFLRSAEAYDLDRLGVLKLESSLAWGDHVEALRALPEARIVPLVHLPFITLAEQAGEIVGFVTVIVDGEEGRAILEDLFVTPAAWRRGIGAQLLIEAERRARVWGATHLWLVANERAQPFYEAHGFRFVERVETELGSGATLQKAIAAAPVTMQS